MNTVYCVKGNQLTAHFIKMTYLPLAAAVAESEHQSVDFFPVLKLDLPKLKSLSTGALEWRGVPNFLNNFKIPGYFERHSISREVSVRYMSTSAVASVF